MLAKYGVLGSWPCVWAIRRVKERPKRQGTYKILILEGENGEFCEFLGCWWTETTKKLSGMVVDIIYSVYLLPPASEASRKIFLGQKKSAIFS